MNKAIRMRPKHLRQQDARRKRFGGGRYEVLVKELAGVIRLAFEAGATASLWGLEGPLLQAIRSDLCLQRWAWGEADTMAREVLADAFRVVNAQRPSWNEGQREWTIHAGTLIERMHCAHCHKPLPEGHHKFCGEICASRHHSQVYRMKQAGEGQALALAIRSI